MGYAKQLTKDYLKYLGITYVDAGGRIFKGDVEIKQHFDGRYFIVELYDPAIRQSIPANKRTNSSGQIVLGVHRVCYAWWNHIVPEGMVVDHVNSDKTDNNIFNLQLLTPSENCYKERKIKGTSSIIKCKLNKPKSYYEEKLSKYEKLYIEARETYGSDSEECHKLRANVAHSRARLKYYNEHIEEANRLLMEKNENDIKAKLKRDCITARNRANCIKDYYKTNNNSLWHYWAKKSRQKEFTIDERYDIDLVYYELFNK